ncbi:class I SAM-dependent methyltransferase [Catenulispora sp. GAS73]|uniref:class I SAM-dependent methyltransferase n=1 Tax=Catenulispora sp. GAS73 TaxID=3156269 RepID=UPI003512C5B5
MRVGPTEEPEPTHQPAGAPESAGAPAATAPRRAEAIALRRPAYEADLKDGLDRFFEPRRTVCPWCASDRLRERLHTTDLLQHKPGDFRLDRCLDCGHIFQNPRLSSEGLEFYYRDFYDGLGEKSSGGIFAGRGATYRRRAKALLPHVSGVAGSARTPDTWLDVGTGHGHFCEAAREVFPDTAFDGLDFTDGAELAERAGRVRHGYRGSFVDVAPSVAGTYDVVSMFHYLEHSVEPGLELEAAHKALRPGGHLLIEVPDAASRYSRLLGRRWLPWLQPQHLHFTPIQNLRTRLTALGFTVLAEQHAEPHDRVDLLAATWFVLDALAPRDEAPWLPQRPGRLKRTARAVIVTLGVPALVAATILDRIIPKALIRSLRLSNAYRVVARRD